MDGGEILILFESTPEMIQRSALGIEGGVEVAAYGAPSGKDKITGSNNS